MLKSENSLYHFSIPEISSGTINMEVVFLREVKEQVSNLRKRMNLNQETFAEKIGKSVDTIRKIEQGNMKLSADVAIAIADAFHVSLDWLYGRADDTNDDASTMLMCLDKLLGFYVDNSYDRPYFFSMAQPFFDFFDGYTQATNLFENGDIPEAAYNPWVDKLKYDFNEAMKCNTERKEYGLVPKEKVLAKNAPRVRIDWGAPLGNG